MRFEPLETESNIYSSDVYSASGSTVIVKHTIITEQNIYLSGENKSVNLYDKSNNLTAAVDYTDGKYIANSYTYDNNNNLTSITHNGFQYDFSYDINGNMTSAGIGNRNLISSTYTGDIVASETYGNSDSYEYVYDEKENLIGQKVNGNLAYEWTYDSEGNILAHNDLLNNISYSYTYD